MINIYKASAGSGKTFTLAREYIKLILGHKTEAGNYVLNATGHHYGHRNVLAMTFTNKATEEMKSRIIHELALLAGCEKDWTEPSPYVEYLCNTFGCDEDSLSAASGEALRALLYDFSRFSISTIDSFFQTVLRSFAHEAEVSGNYALELDDEAVITMSVNSLLQSLNYDSPTKKSREIETWITGYMKNLIDDGNQFTLFNRGGNVQSNLIKFIANIHNDTFKDNEKRIMAYFADGDKFADFCRAVSSRIAIIKQSTANACRIALKAVDEVSGVNKNVISVLNEWSERGWMKRKKDFPVTPSKVVMDSSAMWTATAKKNGTASPYVELIVAEAMRTVIHCHEAVTLLHIIRENLYQLGLFGSLLEIMDSFRRENATLLLSDTATLLSKVIGDDDSPFLYEKIGARFHNYLIDEFQDTSLSQWANMRPLLKETLAYDNDNLVIGDEKQCIYRFRNSDPSLLHNLHMELWAKGRSVVRGDTKAENTNWRSSADVVRFNNALFASIARQWGFKDVYSNVEQQVSSKHESHGGYVRLQCYDAKLNAEEMALDRMARELRRQLESGYTPSDIAILVRQGKEGEKVIAYLDDVRRDDPTYPEFEIISDKSLLISHSVAVSNVIGRLRLISSTDIIMDSRRRSNRDMARLMNDYDIAYASGVAPDVALRQAVEAMKLRSGENHADKSDDAVEGESLLGVDLISLIESIIDTHVSKDLKSSDSAYITAFVDLVADAVSRGRTDIRSFLEWWDDKGCGMSIAGGSDSNALNILTVHKSKGLEFKCVHVPFAEFNTKNGGDKMWFELPSIEGIDDEIVPPMMPLTVSKALSFTPFAEQYAGLCREQTLDRINLLYVAFTRAIDELIVGVKLHSTAKNTSDAGDIPGVAKLIYDGIAGAGTDAELQLAFDNDDCLIIGAPTRRRCLKAEKGTALRPAKSVKMPSYESVTSESVWKNTNVDINRLNRIEIARERGLILHAILSNIRTSSDIDRAFTLLKASPDAATLTDADIQSLYVTVNELVHNDKAAEWFDGFRRVYLEREIVASSGKEMRIDRVVLTKSDELHVIDYKTGSQEPRRYYGQLSGYMDFFRAAGYEHVRGFLYYIDSQRIIEI